MRTNPAIYRPNCKIGHFFSSLMCRATVGCGRARSSSTSNIAQSCDSLVDDNLLLLGCRFLELPPFSSVTVYQEEALLAEGTSDAIFPESRSHSKSQRVILIRGSSLTSCLPSNSLGC